MENRPVCLTSGLQRRPLFCGLPKQFRFRWHVAPWRQAGAFVHQPAQDELAGVRHGPEIKLCGKRCCKDLGLFLGLSLFGGKFPPAPKGFLTRFVFSQFSQSTPNLSPHPESHSSLKVPNILVENGLQLSYLLQKISKSE